LSEELDIPLPYDSLDEVRTRLAELAPHLIKYNYNEPSGFESISLKSNNSLNKDINKTVFSDNIDNFYMTDAISRNSAIMARCT
jgi:NADH dehydrogenase (ubiquinone) Fe-S protein 1